MLYSDIREFKAVLEINPANTAEDVKLNFILEWASAWLEELLGRPGLSYALRTEYYGGTGTQQLLLKSRPIYPFASDSTKIIKVYVDRAGYFGAPTDSFDATDSILTYGTDYVAKIDTDNGLSRSGILVRIGDFWPRPIVRERGYLSPFAAKSFGNVKVTYYGGYTVESLPATLRMAVNLLIARLRTILPIGAETSSESYEERSISIVTSQQNQLLALINPLILSYKNRAW